MKHVRCPLASLLVCSTALLVACSLSAGTTTIDLVAPNGQIVTLDVEIADEPQEWQRGLMEREELASDGMLFVFLDEQVRSFWMKNTLIPLDIYFFDGQGQFVSSQSMDPCEADPCVSYSSGAPAQYALEVARESAGTSDVREGWVLDIGAMLE